MEPKPFDYGKVVAPLPLLPHPPTPAGRRAAAAAPSAAKCQLSISGWQPAAVISVL